MATTYTVTKSDVLDGTSLAVGYTSTQPERGVRRFLVTVTGANDTEARAGTKSGAIAWVYSQLASAYHNELTDMPLQSGQATKIGPYKFIVDMIYGWTTLGHWGGASGAEVVDFSMGGYEGVPCYTVGTPDSADGLPSVTVSGSTQWFGLRSQTDPTVFPQAYLFQKSVVRVRVPYSGNANPVTSTVFGLINKTNNGDVTILTNLGSEIIFAQGTLRFDGANIKGFANAATKFVGYFEFTASPAFSVMSVKYSSGNWTATKTVTLDQGNFSVFPLT